jgi:hypothetical protein
MSVGEYDRIVGQLKHCAVQINIECTTSPCRATFASICKSNGYLLNGSDKCQIGDVDEQRGRVEPHSADERANAVVFRVIGVV